MRKNEAEKRIYRVDNMDTATNYQEGKTGILEMGGLGRVNAGRKYHGFGWGMI